MTPSTHTPTLATILAGALLFYACAPQETSTPIDTIEIRTQALGESSQAVWFSGEGTGLMPSYEERVGLFHFNWARMTPHEYDMEFRDGSPVPPHPPAVYEPFMAEAGRWQAMHRASTGCSCTAQQVGYDPMDPSTAEQEKFVGATCCTLEAKEGLASCVGPLVPCTDERATLRNERRALLNKGTGQIINELPYPSPQPFDAVGMAALVYPPNNAENTSALSAGNTAVGISQFQSTILPDFCLTDPDQEGCLSENLTPASVPVITTGATFNPIPILSNGIHFDKMGQMGQMGQMDQTRFNIHYYDPNDALAGEAQEVKLVLNDVCEDMAALPVKKKLFDSTDVSYVGLTYVVDLPIVELPMAESCTRYVFVAKNGEGFEYIYPSYGSLGIQRDGNGKTVSNDSSCPIWVPQRVDMSCIGDHDTCMDGDTRSCYTGRPGTQEEGQCKLGTETCVSGRWAGNCIDEVTPDDMETCDDNIDNDCNGGVDETCNAVPTDMGDMNNPDLGTEQDMGIIVVTPPKDDGNDDGCSCRSVQTKTSKPYWLLLLGLLFLTINIRRNNQG